MISQVGIVLMLPFAKRERVLCNTDLERLAAKKTRLSPLHGIHWDSLSGPKDSQNI